MDTTNQLASYIRRKTTSNTVSYLNADLLQDLNVRYKRACSAITGKVQDFFWTWWTTNTLTTQNEYGILQFTFSDTTTRDVVSIDWVSIKFKSDQDFYKLSKWDFTGLDFDYANYTDWAWNPFYFVRDSSIFIAPNPLENVTNGLKIYGNYRPLDLTLSDSATEIKIPLLHTDFLAYGVIADYWNEQLREDKAQSWEAMYNNWLMDMVNSLSIRDREITSYEY